MARNTSRSARTRAHSSNPKGKKKSSSLMYALITIVTLAAIGVVVWLLARQTGYQFQREHLDKYVEATDSAKLLNEGASVYLDMSNGMNYAYASAESKSMLQAVINKLAANNAIEFFELSDSKITPLTKSHTELYNYMLNSENFTKQKAPIEETLNRIVDERKPALLMTDFEEYKGTVIEKAAYAKAAFIKWLSMGYNITFYKWDYMEENKAKSMFLAVFDDNANRLKLLVENAVKLTEPNIDTYVLGSKEYFYPTETSYPSLKQGGNYHNEKGVDIVTAVTENGGENDYLCYSKPFASAIGTPGKYLPLDNTLGVFAEFYPLGVSWGAAIENAKAMQEVGIDAKNKYTHLLSKLFIDFGAQDGFRIDGVEVRVFDMHPTMEAVSEYIYNGKPIDIKKVESIAKPEINMVLTAGMSAVKGMPEGWKEIYVDFDKQFNGTFVGDIPSTNLIRANLVISQATPEIDKAIKFFSWTDNPSLANSVKETLTAASSNPQGRILYTYYIIALDE